MVFWFLAAAMTAMAVALVLVPLLRLRASSGPSTEDANLAVLRGQRREIEADIAAGTLPADAREEALAELVGRASEDLQGRAAALSPASRPWRVAATVGLAIPALAVGIYMAVGTPRALDPAALARKTEGAFDEKQVVAMVESLAAKVKERPDDARGWALLARSMASMGRYQEAADAYDHLVKLAPNDAQLLADYADVLGMAQGRKLEGKPTQIILQALAADPKNHKALALAGTAAVDAGDFDAGLKHWSALAAQLPADSDDAREVKRIIDDLRKQSRSHMPAIAAAPATNKAGTAASAATSVSGSVTLSKHLAAQLKGTETVFVFARAEGGPRVPLAVLRAKSNDLPLKFALDDSQAMAPGMNLSSASAVRVEARISSSGNATPQSGDFVGASGVVKPGARDVAILVDKVLP